MSLDTLVNALPQLVNGLAVTLLLTAAGITMGTTLGVVFAFGRTFAGRILSSLILVYEKIFRGIPLIVLFFILYFGLPQIGLDIDALSAAVLGLGLRSAAYQAQIYRGSINAIPSGQLSAAYSLGMSKLKAIRFVIFPQMMRLSLPGWSNEFTILLKDTSLAFGIGVIELMRQGNYIQVRDPNLVLPVFLIIAAIYLALVLTANKILKYLDGKYRMVGYQPEAHR